MKSTPDLLTGEEYSFKLVMFDPWKQLSVITTKAAMDQGLCYVEVPETYVMLSDRRREQTTKMFILDALPYRARLGSKKPESVLVTAHGVEKAALATTNPPELPLLSWRFETRPGLSMGSLAQKTGPTELVLGKDNSNQWPVVIECSRHEGHNLHLMRTQFHPGQLLYGKADLEATEERLRELRQASRGVRGRWAQGSSGPSSPDSERSWE